MLVKFGVNKAIENIGSSSFIVHAHVVLVLKAHELEARYAYCHRILSHIHQVVNLWDKLRCVVHGKGVYFKSLSIKSRRSNRDLFVFKVNYFYGVELSITTFEVKQLRWTDLADIWIVSEIRARVNFLRQEYHEQKEKERVDVRVEKSNSLTEIVYQKRVESIFIEINKRLNSL